MLRSLSKLKLRACVSITSISPRVIAKCYSQLPTIINDGTLIGRLFIYLNKDNNYMVKPTIQSIGSTENILKKIYNMDIDELENNLNVLQQSYNDNTHGEDLLSILDSALSFRVKLLPVNNILRLLNLFMNVAQSRIIQYQFYKLAIVQLNHNISLMDKNELLQSLFYLALQKSNKFTKKWIEKYLPCLEKYIESLTIEDWCVICSSTFKTSTLIKNAIILDKVKHLIIENIIILNDPAFFTIFAKTIRHNKCQDESTLSTISCALLFNKTYSYYSFGELCHVLAIYADYFYCDQKLFDMTIQQCLNSLKTSKIMSANTYMTPNIRNKYITRFLWILSNMNFKLNLSNLDLVSSKIMERIELKHYTTDMEELIKCALYLWTLNYQALDIIQYCFERKHLEIDTNSDYQQRISLLLTCIRRENPALYSKINEKPVGPTSFPNGIKLQINKRPYLQRILSVLKSKPTALDLNRFEYTCEVPYLHIVGITGFKKGIYKSIYIEVLDNHTSLKNTDNHPNGLMALKLRLLDSLDEGVLQIEECATKSMTEKELKDYLTSKVNNMCRHTHNK